MKLYHVDVTQEDSSFVGRVLEREGITTQGKTLDELVFMVRDAIFLMWNESGVQLELIIPRDASTSLVGKRSKAKSKLSPAAGRRGRSSILSSK